MKEEKTFKKKSDKKLYSTYNETRKQRSERSVNRVRTLKWMCLLKSKEATKESQKSISTNGKI